MKKKIIFVSTIVFQSAYFPVDRETRARKVAISFVNFIGAYRCVLNLKNNSL